MKSAVDTDVSVLAVQYALLFASFVCNAVPHCRADMEVAEMDMAVVV